MTFSSYLFLSSLAKPESLLNNGYSSKILMILFSILLIAIVPFRDLYTYDMVVYYQFFAKMESFSLIESLELTEWEPLFVSLQWVFSKISIDLNFYIIAMLIVYLFIFSKAIKNIFLPWQRIFVYFAYLNFAFFYTYTFNGTRQGFSMMLLILAISILLSANTGKLKFYLVGASSILFHYSVAPLVIFLFLFRKYKISLKAILIIWSFSAILFISGINQWLQKISLVAQIDYVEYYTGGDIAQYFNGVNRPDFLVFGAFFICLFLFLYKKIDLDQEKKIIYLNLIKIYIAFNTYFLIFGFISFSNRLAMYSWFLIPMLVLYPFLYAKKHSPLMVSVLVLISLLVGIATSALEIYK